MKVLVRAATNIGKIAKRIEEDLNKNENMNRYSVNPLSGSPGIVRVTDNETGKFRSIKLKYENKTRKRTVAIPWDTHYTINDDGDVFDDSNNCIGHVQVIPLEPNKEGKCRNYVYDGMINTSPDSWQEVNEKNIEDVKRFLS